MINLIKKFINMYMGKKEEEIKRDKKHFISKSLANSISYFKNEFSSSADLTIRQMEILGLEGAIITIEGMVNKEALANTVVTPIKFGKFKDGSPMEKYTQIRDKMTSICDQLQVSTYEDAFALVMSGFALIALDKCDCMLAIGVQGFSFRSISEPSSEVMQRGSREGFVEPLRINMSLIRRRIKNPKLKFELGKLGTMSKTDICLCYLTDRVSDKILDEVRKRLDRVNLETVMAAGYVVPYLEEKNDISLFSSVGMSERPDTICGKLAEGRIAIIVDGTPNVIIVPYLFAEYFQTLDDYSMRPYFATLIRFLKYLAFLISILLPGLYVGIGTFNPELLPWELLNKIALAVGTTPFSLMMETLIIHFIYEIMREAGLRLPKPLGHAVSIVGGLVIGDAAVSSGLVGSPTLMVVALTAISSYVIPNLYEPIALLRFVFIIIGGSMGIWGIMLLFSVILTNICSKNNYGIPFTAPISPFSMFGMRDVFFRMGWKILARKENMVQSMPGANVYDHTDGE